jgi:hypothetical protein
MVSARASVEIDAKAPMAANRTTILFMKLLLSFPGPQYYSDSSTKVPGSALARP